MPQVLRSFNADDWSEWLLEGPDPAQEGLGIPLAELYALPHPKAVEDFRGTARPTTTKIITVGIGDRPALVAIQRREDAYKRWTEARRSWLAAHVSETEALHFWIDAVAGRHRTRRAAYGRLEETGHPHGW